MEYSQSASPAKREVINRQIDDWYAQGIIEPSKSPWGAPVVIAYRNGKPQFCVDYQKLNATTIPDEFSLPRQTEILAALSGVQVLSSLDDLSGFIQLDLDEKDIEKTAFCSHRGLFQFRWMPFGLRNGLSIFQRVMQGILAPYLWMFMLVYIDDIVVYSKNLKEHIDHLDKVLTAVEESGITLSPTKCHFFYSSILLLGHKVSCLGLSTHYKKGRAVSELSMPKKVSDLQSYLGMLVYFEAFIPYFTDRMAPLFEKGIKWEWKDGHQQAWELGKLALQNAPVLDHPIEGLPYRLYTDASDIACGCTLQQVQKIKITDLKGTKAYDILLKAWNSKSEILQLYNKVMTKVKHHEYKQQWGDGFEKTEVWAEWVIGHYSRKFRSAETRYSTTEREALAAKEGLIWFQPYIEGEKIALITDHAMLQWARMYKNSNRWLAAWDTVFSAFSLNLEIIHHPGRKHSNIDPLLRIPRDPLSHVSLSQVSSQALEPDNDLIATQEHTLESLPAWKVKALWSMTDAFVIETRNKKQSHDSSIGGEVEGHVKEEEPQNHEQQTLDQLSKDLWQVQNPALPAIHIMINKKMQWKFEQGYLQDSQFWTIYKETLKAEDSRSLGRKFLRDENSLLFFLNTDFQPRLCVPRSLTQEILTEAHESPLETAHMSSEQLWKKLTSKFYWRRMKNGINSFYQTCDICQRTKNSNFSQYRFLIPNLIPTRPYESISMDFIMDSPWSKGYNTIFVMVDRLSKHVHFIPTNTGIDAEEFGKLFMNSIVTKFGLPTSIIADRDPQWTSNFWKRVTKALKTRMALSSLHHPQHDGQTEIVNRFLEVMLRAYMATDKTRWAEWLPLLEFAYNSHQSPSMSYSPFFILLGFQPTSPLERIAEPRTREGMNRNKKTSEFLNKLESHQETACLAIAWAQKTQAKYYNKGCKPFPELSEGSLVLVNPHSLAWKESSGKGAKLTQRWISPFEIMGKVNPKTYWLWLSNKYSGSPIFNIEHLKIYKPNLAEFSEHTTLPETRIGNAQDEYEVEDLIGHQYQGNKTQYLIRWKGYGPKFDSWASNMDLKNAPDIVKEYRRKNDIWDDWTTWVINDW